MLYIKVSALFEPPPPPLPLGRKPQRPWEALEAIFVERMLGLNPPKSQGLDGLGSQEGRLSKNRAQFFFGRSSCGLLVASLGGPEEGNPGRSWEGESEPKNLKKPLFFLGCLRKALFSCRFFLGFLQKCCFHAGFSMFFGSK